MNATEEVAVVFCVDRNALVGLHVALSTMLRACSSHHPVRVMIAQSQLLREDIDSLKRTVAMTGHGCEVSVVDVNPRRFEHMRSLGGWMTYARLLLPDILDVPRFIYMDADVIVGADVAALWNVSLGGRPVGAASWSTVASSHDRDFLAAQGVPSDAAYFNNGVLLVDAVEWRRRDLTARCLETGRRHGKSLPTADQTILNLVLSGDFQPIDRRYNTPVSPHRAALAPDAFEQTTIHLISGPKPWDLFGCVNGQRAWFRKAVQQTAMADYRPHYAALFTRRGVRQTALAARCIAKRLLAGRRPAG